MDSKHPFEKVVGDHGATVLRVCRVLLIGPDADDAWSETFLSAMRAYPDLPESANVEAWLVTNAHRNAVGLLRRRQRHQEPAQELPGSSHIMNQHTDLFPPPAPEPDTLARLHRQLEEAS